MNTNVLEKKDLLLKAGFDKYIEPEKNLQRVEAITKRMKTLQLIVN
jgi:hypothetical protein